MNSVNFKHWFENKLLPNIPNNSIIVMGNASYHSVQLNKPPTSSSKKSVMQSWLQQNNIQYEPNATKVVLYDIIKLKKERIKVFELDCLAESKGHSVVRLPPYHCNFNAIEFIWAQIKMILPNITYPSNRVMLKTILKKKTGKTHANMLGKKKTSIGKEME